MGVFDILGPGLDCVEALAWSLCCQQYKLSSLGSSVRILAGLRRELPAGASSAVIGRRQGRPLDVTPLHVVDGFLESERPIRASGVLAKKGIAVGLDECLLTKGKKSSRKPKIDYGEKKESSSPGQENRRVKPRRPTAVDLHYGRLVLERG